MSQPFIGEIRMFAGSYAPSGWAFCDGTILSISEYDALFALIGTSYGGDGQVTFALPDLRGRVPVHQGNGLTFAQSGGLESVALTQAQLPAHTHQVRGSAANATATSPAGAVPATAPEVAVSAYGSDAPLTTLDPGSVAPAGGGVPHDNMQPYLGLSFIIALFGIFPPQN